MYLGWAGIGKLLTQWPAFTWLDESQVGSEEAVTAYCIGFVILAPLSEFINRRLYTSEVRRTDTIQCTSSCRALSASAKVSIEP